MQHFNHLQQLGDKVHRIPVLWWFHRPKAFAFYHDHLRQSSHSDILSDYSHAWGEDAFPAIKRVQWSSNKHLHWRFVLEDLHPGGRGLAGDQAHEANEVILSVRYKLAYVVIRKCANTAIHKFMRDHLGGNWSWCQVRECRSFSGRCTSLCLDPDVHLDGSYLFFSFVQHPVRRFFKALTKLLPRQVLKTSNDLDQIALRLLSVLQERSHAAEHHLETQSFALSSPRLHVGYSAGFEGLNLFVPPDDYDRVPPQIQLDYIGRLETMNEDWKELLNLANQREGVPRIDYMPLEIVRREAQANEAEKRALWTRVMTQQVISLAHEAYAQDVVSLGYGWLNGSYVPLEDEMLAPEIRHRRPPPPHPHPPRAWAQISHLSCASPHGLDDELRTHCHWTARELVAAGRAEETCAPALAINTTEQLSSDERDVYGWTPPDLNESVLQEPNEYEDAEELCAAAGFPLARISARVVEVMLFNHEADHLLVKLLEYGDLLEKLVVMESRMDFNLKVKPLGLALVKHNPAFRRWLHVIDHGEVECFDENSRGSSKRVAGRHGQHPAAWDQDNFPRAAALARLRQMNLSPQDIVVISDADEILTRRAVRVLAECQVTTVHGPGRLELDECRVNFNCCSDYEVLSTTAMTWAYANGIGERNFAAARLRNLQSGEYGVSGEKGHLGELAFWLQAAGWHLPNFMSPSQLYNKHRIWAVSNPTSATSATTTWGFFEQAGSTSWIWHSLEFSCCFSGNRSAKDLCKYHWEADGPVSRYPRILRDNLQVFRQRHWFYNAEDWQ